MMYQSHQIRLWPRLIAHSRQIDHALADALELLVARGATLDLKPDGGLQFGAGAMDATEYKEIVADKLAPRAEKLKTLQGKVKTSSHPWSTAFQQAYQDLIKRTDKATAALTKATATGKPDEFLATAPAVLDRYYQAMAVARVLLDAGYATYLQHVSNWFERVAALEETLRKAGQTIRPCDTYGRSWPVQTPDGWLWVVDVRGTEPVSIAGLHEWSPGELVVVDCELGDAMAALDTVAERGAA